MNLEETIKGKEERGIGPFSKDPYGSTDPLASQRKKRNPFNKQHGYFTSCPELEGLLYHRGPEIYKGNLPWDQ